MRFLLAVCIVKKERNVYVGFRTYLVFSSKDIIGPITPSLGSPSFKNVQSCHSEVGAIKLAESLKKDPKKALMVCTRWSYSINNNIGEWILEDGVPCNSYIKYLKKKEINNLLVSTKDDGLKKMNILEAERLSKPSTGSLYGR